MRRPSMDSIRNSTQNVLLANDDGVEQIMIYVRTILLELKYTIIVHHQHFLTHAYPLRYNGTIMV